MGRSLFDLDRQAVAKIFPFGSTVAGGDALVTINKGTAAASTVVLDVKGSASIAGDLNLIGNLNITGSVNTQNVTNTNVADLTITLNDGGTSAGASGVSGIHVEGDSNAVIGKLLFDNSLTSKWKVGDGTSQAEVVTVSGSQTLTNKIIAGSQISGNIAGNATNVTGIVSVANGGTGLATIAVGSILVGNGTSAPTLVAPGASGNVLVSNGSTWVSQAPSSGGTFKSTTVSGTQDGSNKIYTLGSAVAANSELVTLNGQVLNPGASNDYVVSGTTLTFQAAAAAPVATDIIRVYGVY